MKSVRCFFLCHDSYLEIEGGIVHLKCNRCDRDYTGVDK